MTDLAMELTNTRVRKWGRLKLGLSLYGASGITVPDTAAELFDATTHKPKPFPTGVRELGYITTAGVTDTKSISSTNTSMLQSMFPVRTDFEGIEKTMAAVLGESNAWTNALYHGAKWDTWPADKDAAWLYSDGDSSAFDADYVLWLHGVDGVVREVGLNLPVDPGADRLEGVLVGDLVQVGPYTDPGVDEVRDRPRLHEDERLQPAGEGEHPLDVVRRAEGVRDERRLIQ